jgi:hypothetical protein
MAVGGGNALRANFRSRPGVTGSRRSWRQYLALLCEFRAFWDLPADMARTVRMDYLILLIDAFETIGICTDSNGLGCTDSGEIPLAARLDPISDAWELRK